MRHLFVIIFLFFGASSFAQSLLKNGEGYFSSNQDSLRNIDLMAFHKSTWYAIYEGKIAAYEEIPNPNQVPMTLDKTRENMSIGRIEKYRQYDDGSYPGGAMDIREVSYLKATQQGADLWIAPIFIHQYDEFPILYFKLKDAESIVGKEMAEYVSNTLLGIKTVWTGSKDYDLRNYIWYTNSIYSLVDSLNTKRAAGKLKPYNTLNLTEPEPNEEIEKYFVEPVNFYDPYSFETYDSALIVGLSQKFYGIRLQPEFEIDANNNKRELPSRFLTLLLRTLIGEDDLPFGGFAFKLSDVLPNFIETETKIWNEFLQGKPSTIACYPDVPNRVEFKNEEEKKVFVEFFKRIAHDALSSELTTISFWPAETRYTAAELKNILHREIQITDFDEMGNEINKMVDVPIELDSLLGIEIKQFWRPSKNAGEFEVYRWVIAPVYPITVNYDGRIPLTPYYIDYTELLSVYGKELIKPFENFYNEHTKYESDLFEFDVIGDDNYFYKRIKTGEIISVINAEPNAKKGDRFYFTYVYEKPASPGDYKVVYALRRMKVENE